jgi:hypothetical protein
LGIDIPDDTGYTENDKEHQRMEELKEANRYHVKAELLQLTGAASDQELEKWANDPNCYETETCAKELAERLARRRATEGDRQEASAAVQQRLSERRQAIQDNPFDPRTEVSADAIHIASRIVKHLWIIFVLLPFAIAFVIGLFFGGIVK